MAFKGNRYLLTKSISVVRWMVHVQLHTTLHARQNVSQAAWPSQMTLTSLRKPAPQQYKEVG